MNKLNFNIPIIDVTGTPVSERKLSSALADILGMSTKVENPAKFYNWYRDLQKTGILTIDNIDKKLLQDFIINNENIYLFIKGQILDIINESK